MSIKNDRAYVRVSTLKDSQQDSPENQEALIRENAGREGIEIARVYEDRDSATSIIDRKDVQQMIEDAKRGAIKSIWFASLSRFSRDTIDALSLKRILVNALKIRVVSIEDGYDSGKKDDELLFGIKSVVNQNTSGDISISSRRGIRLSAERGNYTGSIPPYGYKKVTVEDPKMKSGKRKTLTIVEDQARIVKLIFELYVNGMGEKSIVNYLNGGNERKEVYPSYRGGIWGISSVQRILQNENYTGYTVFSRHTTEVAYDDLSNLMNRRKKLVMKPKVEWEKTKFQTHEAIVSKEIFDQAQELRLIRGGGERGGRREFVNVFAKLIFCAECGSAMVTMTSQVRGREYRYLMCSRRRRTGAIGCSNGKWTPYYEMRDDLIKGILQRLSDSLAAMESKGAGAIGISMPNKDFEKDKRKHEKRIEDNRRLLFEIRRQHMLGEIENNQYEFEKEQYEKEIEESENKLKVIQVEEKKSLDLERIVRDTKRSLKELSKLESYDEVEKTRMLLMQAVKRIEVDKDAEIKVHTYV